MEYLSLGGHQSGGHKTSRTYNGEDIKFKSFAAKDTVKV